MNKSIKYKEKLHNFTRRRHNSTNKNYIVLFDLDETLGYFQHISMFFDEEIQKNPKKSKKEIIFKLLDENPTSFRINLFSLLSLLKREKRKHKNIRIALFTNNQGPKYWYTSIVEYLNNKLKYKLFDTVIGPYKIGSYQVEPYRTTHNKSILDIARILDIDVNKSKVIMFDDQYHTNMLHQNVKYIHLNEYLPKEVEPKHHNDGTYEREHIMIINELRKFLPKTHKTHEKKHNTIKRQNTHNKTKKHSKKHKKETLF
jgi:hypothetical protein